LMGGSLGFLGAKYGLFGLINGGVRFTDGPGGFLADNNCFALAMVMSVPLLWYARELVEHHLAKLALAAAAFLTVAAVVMTFSRGGAVALIVVFLVIGLRSRRKLGFLIVVVLFCAPAVLLVRVAYFERLKTIQNYEEEASANSRIVYGQMALQMAADYPWIGVGFGSYNQMAMQQRYMPEVEDIRRQVVHNTYLQMLTDSGVFAFGIYVSLLFGTIVWLGFSARRVRTVDPRLAIVPVALQVSLIAYAVGSTFLSRVQFDLTYYLLMAAAAWHPIAREIVASPPEEPEPETAPEPERETVYS
jgi:putative inorganic carbon (hco3(-)) transporter